MNRRLLNRQDVYVGDVLTWSKATVDIRPQAGTLVVRARTTPGGAMEDVLALTEVVSGERLKRPREVSRAFTGLDAESNQVTITSIGKGCACGG